MSRKRKAQRAEALKRRQLLHDGLLADPKSSTQPTSPTTTSSPKTTTTKPPSPTKEKDDEESIASVECSTSDSATTTADAKDDTLEYWHKRWQGCTPEDTCLFTRGAADTHKKWFQLYWFNRLCDELNDDFSGDHVELGAGRATTSMYMLQHTPCVTLVDQCDLCFGIAIENMKAHDLPIPTMVVGDVRETPLPPTYYASVYSIGLLEHFRDPVKVIEETYRLLKPGGLMFHVIVETDGDGERFPKGKEWYIEAATNAGFGDAQAIEDLRQGMFILTARK